jgi:hypothetical protein
VFTDAGNGGRTGWRPPSSRMYVGGTFMPRSPQTLAMVSWDETVSGPGVCALSKVVSIVALY